MNYSIGNSLEVEFYFPEVLFQPANLSNPILLKYNQYFYHLSRFSNKIDRLYLQENILNDDFGWIFAKNKNYSYWGMSKIDGETHFTSTIKDLINEGSTSRAYSINFYIDTKMIYYKRREDNMKEELEALINEELDKIQPSLEEIYTPIEEEIKEEIEKQNEKVEQQKKEEKKDVE